MKDFVEKDIIPTIRQLLISLRNFQQQSVFCEGISFNQFNILDIISLNKELINQSELLQKLSVEKSTLSRLLNPLIQKKLIIKQRAIEDKREIQIKLTDSGIDVHSKVLLCIIKMFNDIKFEEVNMSNAILETKKFAATLNCCCKSDSECC